MDHGKTRRSAQKRHNAYPSKLPNDTPPSTITATVHSGVNPLFRVGSGGGDLPLPQIGRQSTPSRARFKGL